MIYLVRHGAASANWGADPDPGLGALGEQQAERVAVALMHETSPPRRVVSSPLLRAQQTAKPLAAKLRTSVIVQRAFTELPSPVPLTERSDWLRSIMSGTWADQSDVIRQWRSDIIASLACIDQNTAVFTHFMVLNAVVSHLTANPNILCFQPDNASVTRIAMSDGKLTLEALGVQRTTEVN
ncbi:MAG: histidine phosphatase family protein [Pseudomonadota bacterium]